MGWLWADKPTQAPSTERVNAQSTAPPSAQDSSTAPPLSPAGATATPIAAPKMLSRDEQADLDLAKFLEEVNYEPSSSGLEAPRPLHPFFSSTSASTSFTSTRRTNSTNASPPSASTTDPSLIYPTTMSCRAAFDAAYHCQLPGGQFVNVYRYGSLRDCTELWSQFWFCMRTNRGYMSEDEREGRIWEHYRKRAEEKYGAVGGVEVGKEKGMLEGRRRSSEDVWPPRREMVQGAFEGDLGALLRQKEKEMEGDKGAGARL